MRIALLLPRAGIYRYGDGAFSRSLRYAPLTLTTLAALVPPELGATVEIYDEGIEKVRKEDIRADLVGITSITGAVVRGYAYADWFRRQGTTVIYGGVHATLLPEEAKEHADAVITGPAYETWPQALRDWKAGRLQPLYRSAARIDFSRVPNAARNRIRKTEGFVTINSVQAVFGCPNSCEFCVTPVSCQGYQHRPIPDVLAEIASFQGKHFVFVDPSPTEDVRYAVDLYNGIAPLRKVWTGLATTRLVKHPELMDAMERGGCKGLLIGFESLSQGTCDGIRKGFNHVGNYLRLARELHDRGIAIQGCFVHGLDGDDPDCFQRTLQFVEDGAIDLPRFTICTPFPGTAYFRRLEAEGRLLTRNWALYDAQHVVFQPRGMTADQLLKGHHWIWRQAYRRRTIASRLARSRCFLRLSPMANLSYRRYGLQLPLYDEERMARETQV